MEVAVQQPSEECTANFTVCIVEHPHLPVQRQHTEPAHSNSGMDSKTVPASKIKGQCAANRPNTLIVANRSRSDVSDIGFTPAVEPSTYSQSDIQIERNEIHMYDTHIT